MSENQDSSAASAAVAQPGTTQQSQSSQSPQQSQDSPSTTGAQATAAAAAAAVVVNIGNTGENLVCQWQGCQERCPSAEALYEHVCERHVGRKSTNNLNLTCRWGNCTTTTVKRDHITSHIRVHVPLKPHKCEFCGKAFKRPQDLKKHVKTHADDSVLVRSPEPSNGAAPRPNVMFGMPNGGKAHYFENPLTSANQGYGDYAAPPYHPQGQHGPQPSAAYGNVYYALNGGDASHASMESRKRGYEALNEFFGDLKRRNFDASSYHAIGNRLNSLNLHGLQLPTLNGGVVPEYHAVPAMVNVGGGSPGGYHGGPMPAQPYHLPPMGNLRTKSDLMNIDQFLEQMQSTVYESDDHVAAAGIAQPGAHYVQGGMSYRTSNSPPTATQLPRTMASGTPSVPVPANTSSAHSPHSGTPALTPPSSAQSYTSGRSPQSIHSGHNYQHTSAAIYPTLPATSGQDHPSTGYPTSSGAPASTLSGIFDNDDRRRYTGGMLQRSRPAERHDVEMDETTASPKQADRDRFHDSLVDPALSQPTGSPSDEKERSATPDAKAANLAAADAAEAADRAEEQWVEHVRFIENLRKYISERLEAGDYEDEQRLRRQEVLEEEGQMEGVETTAAASPRKEPASLYPVLRGLDDDNDAKMTEGS